MSFEDQLRIALDGAAASIRQHMEADLRAFADEIVRAASDDRERAVGEATEIATAAATAAVQAQAEVQIGQYREKAQKHTEHLKQVAEGQISEMRKALEDLRAQAEQQLETARRIAHEEIEKARLEVVKAQADIESARGDAAKARADADKAQGDAYRARGESDEARAGAQKAQGEAQEAQGEAQKAQGEAQKAREEALKAQDEAAKAREEALKAQDEAAKARADAETARAVAAEKAEGEIAGAIKRVETARAEARDKIEKIQTEAEDKAEKVRAETRAEVARAKAEVETIQKGAAGEAEAVVVARLSAAHAINERKVADAVERAHTDSHQSELSRAARLADAVRTLDEARGLSEVLERLAQCAGHEVDRAAVLLVKGDRTAGWRLAGWRLAGFGTGAPAAKTIDLSVDEAGLAGAVLESGVAASRPSDASDDQPSLPPFARGAGQRHAMALPVRVGGDVVAVLYADAPRVDTPSSDARWPAVMEVLVRHASRVLEAMTVQQAAGLSLPRPMVRGSRNAVPGPVEHEGVGDEDAARRYARLLLSEIRMYHEPVVDAGRRARDLMSRLGGEIERARRLYEARVPSSVPARSEYFDQELVRTLADGDRTLLGGA